LLFNYVYIDCVHLQKVGAIEQVGAWAYAVQHIFQAICKPYHGCKSP